MIISMIIFAQNKTMLWHSRTIDYSSKSCQSVVWNLGTCEVSYWDAFHENWKIKLCLRLFWNSIIFRKGNFLVIWMKKCDQLIQNSNMRIIINTISFTWNKIMLQHKKIVDNLHNSFLSAVWNLQTYKATC